jgi:DNA polymerase III epsilon subunit-like protein
MMNKFRVMFLDLETSGGKDIQNKITQLAFVIADVEKIDGEYKIVKKEFKNRFFYVSYVFPINVQIHGQTPTILKEWSGGIRFADTAESLLDIMNSVDIVVAHNCAHDKRLMHIEFDRLGLKDKLKPNWYCTKMNYTDIVGQKLKGQKLGDLLAHSGVTNEMIVQIAVDNYGAECDSHDARWDAIGLYLLCEMRQDFYDMLLNSAYYLTPAERAASKKEYF